MKEKYQKSGDCPRCFGCMCRARLLLEESRWIIGQRCINCGHVSEWLMDFNKLVHPEIGPSRRVEVQGVKCS